MTRSARVALLAVLLLIAAVAASSASAGVLLGVYGEIPRFDRLTGQQTTSRLVFLSRNQGFEQALGDDYGKRPMIGLTMSRHQREFLTPRGVARGLGDRHLIALARGAAASGKLVFIRPFGEMNGHWTTYCAYNKNGTKRSAAHSQAWFKQAFRRVYLIMHGGDRATVNARLKALGLPGIKVNLPANPYPRMTLIWNPQGFGSPDLRGNSAQAYYPGDRYVDWVGNDLYDINGRYAWDANLALLKAHPNKPYSLPEWGLWGIDDPHSFAGSQPSPARTRGSG